MAHDIRPEKGANDDEYVIRVASTTPTAPLASAISHAVGDNKTLVLRAVGAGAVNQAVKGIAIAASHVAGRGLTLYTRVGFATIRMPDGEDVSAIVLRVEVK